MSYLSDSTKALIKRTFTDSGLSPEKFKKQQLSEIARHLLFPGPEYASEFKKFSPSCPHCSKPVTENGHCPEEFTDLEAEVNQALHAA